MSNIKNPGIKRGAKAYSQGGGYVEGYAATFDREPDSYGDVIKPGAFTRTLQEWRAKNAKGISIPLLFGHVTSDPGKNIGRVTMAYEDSKGLFVRAEFDAENDTAQYVRKLVKEGRLYQFSFAYRIRKQGTVTLAGGIKANELQELDLFEVSLVQIPANQHATVTGSKSRGSSYDAELKYYKKLASALIYAVDTLLKR